MTATLEHVNYTVSDPAATAAWMQKLFGWHIRWEGDAMAGGHTKHVGTDSHYVAIYSPGKATIAKHSSYEVSGGLNHIAVVVNDLDAAEAAITAHGFKTGNHADYEPGRRFYFHDDDGIEYEVVQYD
ncbi:MAG: VOC family protein [Sulfitobacter sp.]